MPLADILATAERANAMVAERFAYSPSVRVRSEARDRVAGIVLRVQHEKVRAALTLPNETRRRALRRISSTLATYPWPDSLRAAADQLDEAIDEALLAYPGASERLAEIARIP